MEVLGKKLGALGSKEMSDLFALKKQKLFCCFVFILMAICCCGQYSFHHCPDEIVNSNNSISVTAVYLSNFNKYSFTVNTQENGIARLYRKDGSTFLPIDAANTSFSSIVYLDDDVINIPYKKEYEIHFEDAMTGAIEIVGTIECWPHGSNHVVNPDVVQYGITNTLHFQVPSSLQSMIPANSNDPNDIDIYIWGNNSLTTYLVNVTSLSCSSWNCTCEVDIDNFVSTYNVNIGQAVYHFDIHNANAPVAFGNSVCPFSIEPSSNTFTVTADIGRRIVDQSNMNRPFFSGPEATLKFISSQGVVSGHYINGKYTINIPNNFPPGTLEAEVLNPCYPYRNTSSSYGPKTINSPIITVPNYSFEMQYNSNPNSGCYMIAPTEYFYSGTMGHTESKIAHFYNNTGFPIHIGEVEFNSGINDLTLGNTFLNTFPKILQPEASLDIPIDFQCQQLGYENRSVLIRDTEGMLVGGGSLIVLDVCYPQRSAYGLPTLMYPLQADQADYGTHGYLQYDDDWSASSSQCGSSDLAHMGTDFRYPDEMENGSIINKTYETNVLASYAGTVKSKYIDPAWGGGIVIEHEYNGVLFTTTYIHVDINSVIGIGTTVEAGDVLGTVGWIPSGQIHLHYGIRFGAFNSVADRGALPQVDEGNCECTYSSYTSPVAPENFIDPEDPFITYVFSGRDGSNLSLNAVKSALSGAEVYYKDQNNYLFKKVGITDLNGVAQIRTSNIIAIGDSIKITSSNTHETVFAITSDMISNNKIEVPMIARPNLGKIAYPYVDILNNDGQLTIPAIDLEVKAENLVSYRVAQIRGSGTLNWVSYNVTDTFVTISLQDTGKNYFQFDLISLLDTFSLVKSVEYNPSSLNSYTITLNNQIEESKVYIDNMFIKTLPMGVSSLQTSNREHIVKVKNRGFLDQIYKINSDTILNLSLIPISYTNETDSFVFDFITSNPQYWELGITIQNISSPYHPIHAKVLNSNLSLLGLDQQSMVFNFENTQNLASEFNASILLHQDIVLPKDSVYVLKIKDGLIEKILLTEADSSVVFDSEHKKIALKNEILEGINEYILCKRKEAYSILPRAINDGIYNGDTLFFALNDIIIDSDSLRGDITTSVTSFDVSNLETKIVNDTLLIIGHPTFTGTIQFELKTVHDGLINSEIYTVALNSTISVDKLKGKDSDRFSIIPNPNDGRFSLIKNLPVTDDLLVEIFDTRGVLIEKKNFHLLDSNLEFDLVNYSQGLYFIKISSASTRFKACVKKIFLN